MSAELQQKTGSAAQIIYAKESAWGSPPAPADNVYKALPIVGGESLDDNITVYRSEAIRNDRTRNRSVRGTQRPGGGLPLELAATGPILYFLSAVLGGAVTTTAAGNAVSCVQTITISGTPTSGTFRLGLGEEYTAPIAYNANAAAIDSALEALTAIGTGGVAVTGTGPYTATFTTAKGNLPTLVVDDGLLTGGTNPTVTVATTTFGVSASQAVHSFVGTTSNTLPSFTLEKGFTDPPPTQYQAYTGCRVGQFSLQAGIDATTKVSLDIMNKQAQSFTTSTIASTNVVTAIPLVKPFTSIQIELLKDGIQAATISTLSLAINNNLYGDAGFFLGSNLRRSLKAGARDTGGSFTAAFTDATFYNLAKAGTIFSLQLRCRDDDGNQVLIKMPQVQMLPNGSSPKIENDGPLTQNFNYEALKDTGIGSDIQVIVTTTDAAI